MKLLKEKSTNINDTIPEIKETLLYRIYLAIGTIGLPTILFGIISSIELEVSKIGIWSALAFLPSLIVLLKYRNFSYVLKSNLLIATLVLIGIINLYGGALFGASPTILLTAIGLSTLLLEKRATYFWISTVLGVLIIFSILFLTEVLILNVDYIQSSKTFSSWATAILLYLWLGGLFAVSFSYLFKRLNIKINLIHKNEQELQIKNENLLKLLEEKKQSAKELLKAKLKAEESNKLKTEFLHNMSHEVRTPLNGIVGFSQLLNKEGLSEQKRKDFTKIIINSSSKLQKIIDDIVELSILNTKQHYPELSEININEFLTELHSIFSLKMSEGLKLVFKTKNSNKNLKIVSDHHKLTKIFGNIIENAIKFTKKGSIEIGYLESTDNVTIYVKDTGIGIADKSKSIIFDRFSQADSNITNVYGGLGLGLCIAKENTHIVGGKISLDSEEGKGSTFYVELPRKLKTDIPK
ncbi:MAG: ATP-binding protein [Bacteroidales bacterium]|nr:ATP-binding protein [Bacteroidales bacterium]MDD4218013.1 ATP-binding protein [Bacteroidales bacterium]MDY0144243.1 ATP-binding protein [Bacteroidales bacterium]